MEALATYSFIFVGSHIGLSADPLRRTLVELMGLWPFRAVYSLISGGLFLMMILAYQDAPVQMIWHPPIALKHLVISVMPLVCVFLVGGYTSPNPGAVGFERTSKENMPAFGIFRVTRHPVLWAVALWAIAHLFATGSLAAIIVFGSLAALSLIGAAHIDRRKSLDIHGAWAGYMAVTSSIPFVAIAQGRQRIHWREIGIWRFAVAAVLYTVILLSHEHVIGLSPLPMPVD